MVLGVFITFRVLNFCDMTVDGSFPLGACILAACLTHGVNPIFALFLSCVAGSVAGLITTLIYTKFRIPDLLSGILTMTMLYSINLRIMSNRANVSFIKIPTLFSEIRNFISENIPSINPNLGIVIFLIIILLDRKSVV